MHLAALCPFSPHLLHTLVSGIEQSLDVCPSWLHLKHCIGYALDPVAGVVGFAINLCTGRGLLICLCKSEMCAVIRLMRSVSSSMAGSLLACAPQLTVAGAMIGCMAGGVFCFSYRLTGKICCITSR